MITTEKIEIYKKYHGDIDAWARVGSDAEKELMTDEDWSVIDDLIQDIVLLKGGKVSQEFDQQARNKLKEKCHDEAAVKLLMGLTECD